jgi:DNA-binding transcriptional ArsR family regulator
VEQLAEILGLRPSTVSHHLARLAEAGLVSARPESYYSVYRFEPGTRYSEAQVNERLARFHEDTATLRRELVGYRLLQRQRGE